MSEDNMTKDVINFLNFIKSSFYATLDNIYEIQELSEKVLTEMLKKGKDVHDDAEKTLSQFLDNAKKGRDDFKKVMEKGFEDIEEVFKK